jgi:hypothetical protein
MFRTSITWDKSILSLLHELLSGKESRVYFSRLQNAAISYKQFANLKASATPEYKTVATT